jgi:uncharacterized membrane protein YdjX (TVP38/TMEM64 family)|tara:strand:- start:202 stop:789 length:588 start_codon:yes stop_codon:yes gene_type:complete
MFFNDLFLFFVNNNFNYDFLFIFFIISTIAVSLPIPYTFIIITNAYVFGWIGFIMALLFVPLGSLITYIIIKKLKKSLNQISFFQKILSNNKLLENKINKNGYLLLIARLTLPFFIMSVFMSTIKINIKKYIFITIIGSFPNILIYSLVINNIKDSVLSYEDVMIKWYDIRFLLSIALIILFIFIVNKLKKIILK